MDTLREKNLLQDLWDGFSALEGLDGDQIWENKSAGYRHTGERGWLSFLHQLGAKFLIFWLHLKKINLYTGLQKWFYRY